MKIIGAWVELLCRASGRLLLRLRQIEIQGFQATLLERRQTLNIESR